MCALFVSLQVSPLSATRLASLVDERKSKEETNLEFSSTAAADKDESLPKDCLMINIPIMQPARSCQIAQDQPCSLRLKAGHLNQPKLRKCENLGVRGEAGGVGEIVSRRMALLHCENEARMPHSQSAGYEGSTQMRMSHSRSASNKPFEKPGRFEMLI